MTLDTLESMTTISKDNRIVVQGKFTEMEICLTILALEKFRENYETYAIDYPEYYTMEPQHVIKNCTKVLDKIKTVLK